MAREVMRRTASDNEYLHKDFHTAMSVSLDYLAGRFGEESVVEYLQRFATAYYAPLRERINSIGLAALEEHFRQVYAIEGGEIDISRDENEMVLKVEACPAVTYMREHSHDVSPMYIETTRTVNEAICDGTPFAAELVEYDETTGRSVQRFYRRAR